MPGYRVQVIGRKPVIEPFPSVPPPNYPLVPFPQKTFEEVELLWPAICPCCGVRLDQNHGLMISKFKQSWAMMNAPSVSNWEVPYCEVCLQHVSLKQQRPSSSILIEIATLIIAILVVFAILPSSPLAAGLCFMCIILAGITAHAWSQRRYEKSIVRPAMGDTCVSPGPALTYEGWDSDRINHTFIFFNEGYAQLFGKMNQADIGVRVKSGHAS